MAITYTVATNTIQVTGYTEATPCNFTDIYNTDKAGTLSLHDRNGISAVDGTAVAVDRALRPADYIVLGGSSGDLYITITNWTNMTTATIQITGTDRDGNAQTEDIVVNANGTFNTTKCFETVTHTQVTVFTKTDSGSFDYELIQGQWGVVWKQTTAQFSLDCLIIFGDGTTSTYFTDYEKQIVFFDGLQSDSGIKLIEIKENVSVFFGHLDNVDEKLGSRGCSFVFLSSTYGPYVYSADFLTVDFRLMGCSFFVPNISVSSFRLNRAKIYNCVFGHHTYLYNAKNVDVHRTDVINAPYGVDRAEGTFDDIILSNITSQVFKTGNFPFYVSNAICSNYSGELVYLFFNHHCHLTNIDAPIWTMKYGSKASTARIFRKYEFDLKVIDKDENSLQNAIVKIWDKDNNLVVDTTTNANGIITTQTLNYGYYAKATGDVPIMQTPHTMQISKLGYETYRKKFTTDEKIDWKIALYTPKRRFDSLEG